MGDFMAEFCVKCFNNINDLNIDENEYILSDELNLCEGCGQWKRVVVGIRKEKGCCLVLISLTLNFLCKLIIMLYNFYKRKKKSNN